jgi:histidinol-phosphate aminotransferase
MNKLIRSEIQSLTEYRLTQYPHRIKLNQNENPYELPDEIKEEIMRRFASAPWSRYPEFVPRMQIEQVAEFAQWKPGGTLLGNGSNDLLQVIFAAVLGPGRSVVISQPTFTLYKLLGRGGGAEVIEVPMGSDFRFDTQRIIQAANDHHASMVVLCSPNNPTGSFLPQEEVVRILEGTRALIVLDEAYVHFAPYSCVRLLDQSDRLVLLQTFSKAMGAASLRFGYALAPESLARELNKIKLPYSVNTFTLIAAEVLMKQWSRIRDWIGTLVAERERVKAAMRLMPAFRVYDSAANFLLFETLVRPPTEIFHSLLGRGILIRDVSSYPMLNRGLRVSIGTPDENTEFLEALKASL